MPTRMKLGKNLLNMKQKHIKYLVYIEKATKLPVTQTADVSDINTYSHLKNQN